MILFIKKIVYYYFNLFNIRGNKNKSKWEKYNFPLEKNFENSKIKVGIVKEAWNLHYYYIIACNELNISYKVLDIFSVNWLEEFINSKVNVLIFRPSVQYSPWKQMFDNRIKLLKNYSNIIIFPNPELMWLWESKKRLYEWLKINNYPLIETKIFYSKDEALQFARETNYPVVYKADNASGASGVKIIKNYYILKRLIKKCFGRGVRTYRKHPSDKEHGFIILQKYLPDILEWRIFRMGNYYFGFQKLKKGRFHSGSHQFGYGMPPIEALNLVRNITEKHKFYHTSFDIFIDKENNLYINEIQVYFGQYQDRELLRINNKPGRLFYNNTTNSWTFEEGEFCKNNMANIRLQTLLDEF